jgi:hypothetical protein
MAVRIDRSRPAVLIGRGLAFCAHPYATWRTRSTRTRFAVTCSYAAAAYLVVLTALLMR